LVYGVMSYAATHKRREPALRMALGANAANLLRLVFWRGPLLMAIGVLIRAAVALRLTRSLITNLLDSAQADPWAFGALSHHHDRLVRGHQRNRDRPTKKKQHCGQNSRARSKPYRTSFGPVRAR
jgi:hypothetical protein